MRLVAYEESNDLNAVCVRMDCATPDDYRSVLKTQIYGYVSNVNVCTRTCDSPFSDQC